ncbi:MAG: DksA/TraR family C4 zinc finger domain-containing protein [Parcubacteria group bacterium Licking1014_17]|nr:MAG: DksA/TraR family C4 zinc finger domain-containing protein [Parcubacteria group bacterium Licking1014_17]
MYYIAKVNAKSLSKLRQKLISERKLLEEESKKITGGNDQKTVSNSAILGKFDTHVTSDERARFISEFADEIAIEKMLEARIALIDSTIAKIDQDKYSLCENCGNLIELKRLEAMPCALFCANCIKKQK